MRDIDMQAMVHHMDKLLNEEDNNLLLAPFQIEEFKKANFHMHNDKSLGLNWLNSTFYKKFWNLLGDDIFLAATTWLNQGVFLPSLNSTYIVLIPKNDNPISILDLRPISLCNVLYNIISKGSCKQNLAYSLKVYIRRTICLC